MPEGRYLLGVEPAERTASFLGRSATFPVDLESIRVRCAAAQAARVARGPLAQATLPCPESYADHLSQVRSRPLFQSLFQGYAFDLCLADLASLVPVQPHADYSFALEAVAEAPREQAVLDCCLPAGSQTLDVWGGVTDAQGSGSFTVCSRDLNLIVSEVHMDADPVLKVTFTLSKTAVFMVVAEMKGRLFLKDGTHRALGLLARGVEAAPCVLLHQRSCEPIIPEFLPRESLFGPHPPRLQDFLDERLYLAHPWRRSMKVIRIRSDDFVLPTDDTDMPPSEDQALASRGC